MNEALPPPLAREGEAKDPEGGCLDSSGEGWSRAPAGRGLTGSRAHSVGSVNQSAVLTVHVPSTSCMILDAFIGEWASASPKT